MIIYSPNPVAFSIHNFNIYWYGIILACAVLAGVLYANYNCKKFALPVNFWIDNSPLAIFTGIIGARLYYCMLNFEYYSKHLLEVINIRQGGLSIHGMLLIGIVFLFLLSKYKKLNFWNLTDSLSCSIPLAQAIGRWGNFFNAEAFGIPTNQTWGLFIPLKNRPPMYENYNLFHPTFLYESVADLLIFLLMIFLAKKNDTDPGAITLSYLILYSIVRMLIEGLRIDSVLNIGFIHIAQLVSIATIFICIFIYLVRRHK